ncbi:PFL_4669 family integrating conjugative element protein [Xenorhabdus szentirmaii]|uniref:Integrating conjugative element protein n=1 Tax=Xenorhabdus szentirmaii DSM 16338 TaxID=1427518 RepID=W1J422_9GAMM|nr:MULTISPECIES: TIGR03761 family integrating conjugative element protein [Xenorhabdus]MBD2794112.1 TIGR03761 family integrating conjugative element protein [Xenorhabdus sp. CUL]MBD2806713.1 TIGR03761 family integrating conjugative element protein [Xenorhabdus sp. ZM]MBD2822324.1 TIGR03761 family integrating conjugative element protein [Xenorhabdus sp. 42]PHM30966.1 integrating conjugative element protein [Xenorhabdus szentirmaii DSM 16338]PHM44443.1 integrating conjugative element protein [Xe
MSEPDEKTAPPTPRRAGALKSALSIELHTHYAIRLWEGRKKEDLTGRRQYPDIIGMPQVIKRAGTISMDAAADNPYAECWLIKLEQSLATASASLQQSIATLQETLNALPEHVTLSAVSSVEPLNIGVYSHSPLGYRCVWLLIGYDQLAMKTFQAFHYGFISRSERDALLHNGSRVIRQIYGLVRSYRPLKVTRADIEEKTPAGLEAIKWLGEPEPDILSGRLRSGFSPIRRAVVQDAGRG